MRYTKRNKLLSALGWDSYSLYLRSMVWSEIRARVFASTGNKCAICSRPAQQVHHKQYTRENLSGQSLEHLIPICAKCHKTIEVRADGVKEWPQKTHRRMRLLKSAHDRGDAAGVRNPMHIFCARCGWRNHAKGRKMCKLCEKIEPTFGVIRLRLLSSAPHR